MKAGLHITAFVMVFSCVRAQVPLGPGGGSDLFFVRIHPADANLMYTGGDIEGLFLSADGGSTWRLVNNNVTEYGLGLLSYWTNDIVLDPANPALVYWCTGTGLFRSSDTANTWQLLWALPVYFPPEEYASVATLAISPASSNILLMGLGDRKSYNGSSDFQDFAPYQLPAGVFISTDGGQSWTPLPLTDSLRADSASVQAIVWLTADTIFVCATYGIWRSTDGGTSWQRIENNLPHNQCNWLTSVSSGGTTYLFLSLHTLGTSGNPASFSGGIFRSTDYGNSWTNITGNLPRYSGTSGLFYEYWQIAAHPASPDTLYAGTSRGSHWDTSGLWVTYNATAPTPTWTLLYQPSNTGWLDTAWFPDPYVRGISLSSTNPDLIAISHVYVDISTDGGTSWQSAYTIPTGRDWQGNGLECMNVEAVAFSGDSMLFFVGYDDMGLWRTQDGGTSFLRLDPQMDPVWTNSMGDAVRQVVVDPDDPAHLYVVRDAGSLAPACDFICAGGILYSADTGSTFTDLLPTSIPSQSPWLAADFATGTPGNRTLYMSVFGDNIYKSTDNGVSWAAIGAGLGTDKNKVWKVVLDPTKPQRLYAALNLFIGGGSKLLYRSDDGGQTWQALSLPVSITGSDAITDIIVDKNGNIYVSYEDVFRWTYETHILRSQDLGQTWEVLFSHALPLRFDVHPRYPDNLIVGISAQFRADTSATDAGTLYISQDGGNTWNTLNTSPPHHGFNFVRFSPHTDHIYIGTAGGGLWRMPAPISRDTTQTALSSIPSPSSTPITIRQTAGTLHLSSPFEVCIHLCDPSGKTIAKGCIQPAEPLRIRAPAGIYILTYRHILDPSPQHRLLLTLP